MDRPRQEARVARRSRGQRGPIKNRSASAEPHTATPKEPRLTLSISQYAFPTPGCGPYGGSCRGNLKVRRQSGLAATRAHHRRQPASPGGYSVEHPYKPLQITQITNHQPITSNVGLLPRAAELRRCLAPISHLFHFSLTKFWQIAINH